MSMVEEQRAERTVRIARAMHHWCFADERIGGAQSDSYSLYTRSGVIFVDPLPMLYRAAEDFPSVAACILTRGCHQRACWRYRYEHGARVISPRGSPGLRTEPDQHYVEGTRLPGDFTAIHAPGPEYHHYALYRPGEPSVLFVGELVRRRDPDSRLELAPVDPGLRPDIGKLSVERLLELEFDLLCLSHGGYVDVEAKLALAGVLERS